MLKKTIKYTNFNDEEVEEDFYFHLSKAELVELEMGVQGGLSEMLKKIVAAEDAPAIIAEFKKIILMSYGKKSEDGRQFIKSQELKDEFVSTEAYSALFMELVTDTEAGIEFINGVIPKGLAKEAAKIAATEDSPQLAAVPEEEKKVEVVPRQKVHTMGHEELIELGKRVEAGEAEIAD